MPGPQRHDLTIGEEMDAPDDLSLDDAGRRLPGELNG
jgi:hypothetical protein